MQLQDSNGKPLLFKGSVGVQLSASPGILTFYSSSSCSSAITSFSLSGKAASGRFYFVGLSSGSTDIKANLLNLSSASQTETINGSVPPPAVIKNIKTDFGAACNGVDNDVQAFTDFHEWALQWQSTNDGIIELDIPAGSVCEFIASARINVPSASSGQFSGRFFARGIRHLRVVGYGAAFDDANGTGAGYFVGSLGQSQDNAHDARVYTAFAGATSVQLLDPTQSALFTAGNYVVLTGFDLMGYGNPSNPQYFEFLKVLDVNSTTGVVTFSSPLMNSYLSTWPLCYGGSPTYLDQGGPATLYALDPFPRVCDSIGNANMDLE